MSDITAKIDTRAARYMVVTDMGISMCGPSPGLLVWMVSGSTFRRVSEIKATLLLLDVD